MLDSATKFRRNCDTRFWLLLCFIFAVHSYLESSAAHASNKHIVLIAGLKSHEPGGHEYLKSIKLLKVLLDRAPNLRGVQTHIYFNGWPDDPRVLDRADTIAFFTAGEDGFGLYAPFMTDERMRTIEKQIRRGCGFMTYHFSTYSPARYAPQILSWNGGYFDRHSGDGEGGRLYIKNGVLQRFNEGPRRQWHSAIIDMDTDVVLVTPRHPIAHGVAGSFRLNDEYYYQITFRQGDPQVEPILRVPALSANATDSVVAWSLERKDGGRGFGITAGHHFENWKNDNYRKLILNALVWTAAVAVPRGGVDSTYVTDTEVDQTLMEKPIPTLFVANSRQIEESRKLSTEALATALNSEMPRFQVDSVEDTALMTRDLSRYRLLIVNNCGAMRSWSQPTARDLLRRFVRSGGGLVIVSTADERDREASSHSSSEFTEQRKICREVEWRSAEEQGYSVELPQKNHSITKDIEPYEVGRFEVLGNIAPTLNFTLEDQNHIQVLASAHESGSGDHPRALAFIVQYENARIYQVIGGRDLLSVPRGPQITRLVRYGALWAAGE